MSRYFTNFNETLGSAVYPQSAAPAFAAEEASLPVQPDEEMQRESIVPRREPARQRWSSQTEADADNNQLSDIQNESGADSGAAPMPGKGYLLVQVSLAGRSIPVEGAAVTVQSSEGEEVWNFVTDESGKTPVLELPAPSRELSQQPGNAGQTYSMYNTRVTYPGYYIEENLHIPIFDGIKSIQPVIMHPLPENSSAGEIERFDETESYPQ